MQRIRLTDLPAQQSHRDLFEDGEIQVFSRSGLHPVESTLIRALPMSIAGPALVFGNRTGALGLILAAKYPQAEITHHVLDIHHARAIERTLATNEASSKITVACAPFLPTTPEMGFAVGQISARDTPMELLLDQLENLHRILPTHATCLVGYDGKPDWLRKQIKQIFGNVVATPMAHDVTCYRMHVQKNGAATSPSGVPDGQRNFAAHFQASLPGDAPIQMTTLPGVFAHRRPDEGGLALAEVAMREMQPDARILDMGCGCGLTGLLLAHHDPSAQLLAVDSHARAVYCTDQNAAANNLKHVNTRLSDTGVEENGFSLFVGNPPYYSDYQIAELFIRTAYDALAPGGIACVVAKNHRWHESFMQSCFGNATTVSRRGYGVVKSVRS